MMYFAVFQQVYFMVEKKSLIIAIATKMRSLGMCVQPHTHMPKPEYET